MYAMKIWSILGLALALSACAGRDVVETPPDPELVLLSAELGNDFVAAGATSEVVARLRIGTRAIPTRRRAPLNIAVVIDTSGSMRGEPIEDAKSATLELLGLLSDGDRLSIVAFHSETEVLLESSPLDAEVRANARAAIEGIEARGTTDMAGGLHAGLQQVLTHRGEADYTNRVVLLGDGVPNDVSAIPNLARSAGGNGIAISALGLGLDYDETLMGEVAQLSGGHFHYLEDSTTVASVFRDEVIRLERVVARNASLTLQPGPGVIISSVVGQQTPGDRTALSIALGDIAEGETKDIIVRLRVPSKRAGSVVELLDARLSFIDAVDDAGALRRDVFLGADATESDEELTAGRNDEVMHAAEQASAAEATIQAIRVVREGHIAEARRMLEETQRRMSKNGGGARHGYASSVAAFANELAEVETGSTQSDSDDAEAPGSAPAPARMERRLREAHEASMDVLGY